MGVIRESQSLSPKPLKLQMLEVRTEESGWVWVDPPHGDVAHDHPESRQFFLWEGLGLITE